MTIDSQQFQTALAQETFVIESGSRTSNSIAVNSLLLTALRFPAAITGTSFTIEESTDNLTFSPIRINAAVADFAVTPVASKTIVFDNAVPLSGFEYARIVSNATEAGQRVVTALCRPA